MNNVSESQLRELARKRVEFRIHLVVYLVCNTTLWAIWYFTGKGYLWPIWPMGGWGIGVVFHYLFDYRSSSLLSEEKEYEKLRRHFKRGEGMAS